jgi:nitrite reductase/ring-hydroxylating ferredoxin subunit
MKARRPSSVCRADELVPGERRVVAVEGIEVGVFNLDGKIVAYRNHCPHQGGPVCLGRWGGTTLPSPPGEYVFGRHGRVLVCPWHGWEFDLDTGEALFGRRVRLAPVETGLVNGTVVLYVGSGEAKEAS